MMAFSQMIRFADRPFPNAASININHLGISSRVRFTAKHDLIRKLADRNRLIGVQELHLSEARAQDSFFDHYPTYTTLYNVAPGCPGQCIMIQNALLVDVGLDSESARNAHHEIFIPGIAHCFWWMCADELRVFVNIHLSPHSASIRRTQIETLTRKIEHFCAAHRHSSRVIVLAGDRNFVVNPYQHMSSAGTSWHPGDAILSAWRNLLNAIDGGDEYELEVPTFSRYHRPNDHSNNQGWICKTLDCICPGFDRVRHAHWQCKVYVNEREAYKSSRKASDHRAVEMRFQLRRQRCQHAESREEAIRRDMRPLPEWLFHDLDFRTKWLDALTDWEGTRSSGLGALGEFADITRQYGKDWLRTNVVEATCDEQRFEICMTTHMDALLGTRMSMQKYSKRLQAYPLLLQLCEVDIDMPNSSVRVITSEALITHIHALVHNIASQHDTVESDSTSDDTPRGSLINNVLHQNSASYLKSLLPCKRHQIIEMWCETSQQYENEPYKIGQVIRNAGLTRSGNVRGDPARGQGILDSWHADFSSCRRHLSLSEVMQILLGLQPTKKPGTTGVGGIAYKVAASIVAPVFIESFDELQCASDDSIQTPPHLGETLWIGAAKKQGANKSADVRDLELPNEDAKILERMHVLVIDEVASSTILIHNQAFVRNGDIMRNLVHLHETWQRYSQQRQLIWFLFMDCQKGFNMLSHSWILRVLQRARLPASLIRSISRLMLCVVSFLVFAGIVYRGVNMLSGLRQGGPLSALLFVIACAAFLHALVLKTGILHVFGFADDWQCVLRGVTGVIRSVRDLISEFEACSGTLVHRTKTKWLANRYPSRMELRALTSTWPGANIVRDTVALGTPLGHNVTVHDFLAGARGKFNERAAHFRQNRMSYSMRILAMNTFMLPIFSYIERLVLLPPDALREISHTALRFVTPVPFCSHRVLVHCHSIFGVNACLRDPCLDNLAALLSTGLRLQAKGALTAEMLDRWVSDYGAVMADDMVPQSVWLERPGPIAHMVVAHSTFRRLVGKTPEAYLGLDASRSASSDSKKLHCKLYGALVNAGAEYAAADVKQRFLDKGWDANQILANLAKLPYAIPQAHRITFMKFILNGLPTSRRMRHVNGGSVEPCPFCSQEGSDDVDHWLQCRTVREIYPNLHPEIGSVPLHSDVYHLTVPLGGRQLQLLFAIVYAIWRCRCACARALHFASIADLGAHMKALIDDPWLRCASAQKTRRQRRAMRALPPRMPFGCCIYNCDGASRTRGGERNASAAAVLRVNGLVVARCALCLGDATNNEAEYTAALLALRHILVAKCRRNFIRLDSLLVTRQLNGEWACRALHLQRMYEEGLNLINQIRRHPEIQTLEVGHVYREFNASADSTANECLDISSGAARGIDENWATFMLSARVLRTLRDAEHGERDADGDVNMHDVSHLPVPGDV